MRNGEITSSTRSCGRRLRHDDPPGLSPLPRVRPSIFSALSSPFLSFTSFNSSFPLGLLRAIVALAIDALWLEHID